MGNRIEKKPPVRTVGQTKGDEMKQKKNLGCLLLLLLSIPGFTDSARLAHNRQEVGVGDCGGSYGSCVSGDAIMAENVDE